MKLTLCECGPAYLMRINRSFWMRWVPNRRLYYCTRCDAEMFLTRVGLRRSSAPSGPAALAQGDSADTPIFGRSVRSNQSAVGH